MAPTVDMIALLRLLARLVLVAVFVSAALPKLQDPAAFAVDIQNYRLSGPVVAAWGATVLPWLELTIGVGLLTRSLRRVSGLVIAALLILFIGLHASAWLRGLDVACEQLTRRLRNLDPAQSRPSRPDRLPAAAGPEAPVIAPPAPPCSPLKIGRLVSRIRVCQRRFLRLEKQL